MAFGTFHVEYQERGEKAVRQKPVREKNKRAEKVPRQKTVREKPAREDVRPVRPAAEAKGTVSVLLAGRSAEGMRDYLCAMMLNTDRKLGGAGMSLYTLDSATIAEKVFVKKELDQLMMRKDATLRYPSQSAKAEYSFCISPSGKQDVAVEFRVSCRTIKNLAEERESVDLSHYDAVWILAELPCAEPGRNQEYAFLGRWLDERTKGRETPLPVCVLAVQFEHLGWQYPELSKNGEQIIREQCLQLLPCAKSAQGLASVILPMQMYGGLTFAGWEADGTPILSAENIRSCREFAPAGCEHSVYETLAWMEKRGMPFFRSEGGRGLWMSLEQVFAMDQKYTPFQYVTERREAVEDNKA